MANPRPFKLKTSSAQPWWSDTPNICQPMKSHKQELSSKAFVLSIYARNIKGLIMSLQFQANQLYSPALCAQIWRFYLRLNTYSFLSVTQWIFQPFVREGNVSQISLQPNESVEFSWGLLLPVCLRRFVCVWVFEACLWSQHENHHVLHFSVAT